MRKREKCRDPEAGSPLEVSTPICQNPFATVGYGRDSQALRDQFLSIEWSAAELRPSPSSSVARASSRSDSQSLRNRVSKDEPSYAAPLLGSPEPGVLPDSHSVQHQISQIQSEHNDESTKGGSSDGTYYQAILTVLTRLPYTIATFAPGPREDHTSGRVQCNEELQGMESDPLDGREQPLEIGGGKLFKYSTRTGTLKQEKATVPNEVDKLWQNIRVYATRASMAPTTTVEASKEVKKAQTCQKVSQSGDGYAPPVSMAFSEHDDRIMPPALTEVDGSSGVEGSSAAPTCSPPQPTSSCLPLSQTATSLNSSARPGTSSPPVSLILPRPAPDMTETPSMAGNDLPRTPISSRTACFAPLVVNSLPKERQVCVFAIYVGIPAALCLAVALPLTFKFKDIVAAFTIGGIIVQIWALAVAVKGILVSLEPQRVA